MEEKTSAFPKGFLWGAATSSYQVEGGNTNDWSEWEKSPKRLAFLKSKKFNPEDFQSGKAANSWEHFEEDIACLKQINATAYRFSIEWSRIEPQEGVFDEEAINKYHHFIKRLREENIEPFVTLWHWPLPLWLRDKGGWKDKRIIPFFIRYAEKIVSSCPEVTFWSTLNEPEVYASHGYLVGDWLPQKHNPFSYLRVYHNLIHAHRAVYTVIKKINTHAQIGIASHHIYFEAAPGFINKMLAAIPHWWWNRYFLNRCHGCYDFIGINYYHHILVKYGFFKNYEQQKSDMGWGLCPGGLYSAAKDLSRYGKPMYVTEHGIADAQDIQRGWYIQESLRFLQRAISEGADVRGYTHWSLLDNFEWAFGYTHKFGLFSVDRESSKRVSRPSAHMYSEIAKNNHL